MDICFGGSWTSSLNWRGPTPACVPASPSWSRRRRGGSGTPAPYAVASFEPFRTLHDDAETMHIRAAIDKAAREAGEATWLS